MCCKTSKVHTYSRRATQVAYCFTVALARNSIKIMGATRILSKNSCTLTAIIKRLFDHIKQPLHSRKIVAAPVTVGSNSTRSTLGQTMDYFNSIYPEVEAKGLNRRVKIITPRETKE